MWVYQVIFFHSPHLTYCCKYDLLIILEEVKLHFS